MKFGIIKMVMAFFAITAVIGFTFALQDPAPMSLTDVVETVLWEGQETTNDGASASADLGGGGGGSASNYCQATMNSFGVAASIGFVGSLDLADGSFGLSVAGVPPNPASWGMFTYGTTQMNVPFGNGYLCISPFSPGIYRMATQSLGGTVVNLMSEHPYDYALFAPGSSWNFQFWYRDPNAGGARFNLSDGLHVNFAP